MRQLRTVWKSLFDVRSGEAGRTFFMALYLLFVMFAYYILKPVSRALFLHEFKVDKLPYLNMLIALGGGSLAYLYSRVAVRASLRVAVAWVMGAAAACLLGFWLLISPDRGWMLYVFNIWVSLFSIVLVTQGWLVAANVFDPRAAKRLYGLLGLGAVVGAAFGGAFTAFTAKLLGRPQDLLLASIAMLGLAYLSFRVVVAQKGVKLVAARASQDGKAAEFRLADLLGDIRRHRHLQVIIGIITLTYIVGTLTEFQFQKMASQRYHDPKQLAAFLGMFQGVYTNALTFLLQLFAISALVRRLGVGGTLQVMPAALASVSVAVIAVPGLGSAMGAELTESATRYTVNRTAMELLYLPLPTDLRNRTKGFVDIFMDRMGRGLGGALLAALLALGLSTLREIAALALVVCGAWMFLTVLARREYLETVRHRLAARRLDLEGSRINVTDPATIQLLEQTARGASARQACYALSVLAEAPDYEIRPLLLELAGSPHAEVRGRVFEIAWFVGEGTLYGAAQREIAAAGRRGRAEALKPAVGYVMAFAPEPLQAAREMINHVNAAVAEAAIDALRMYPDWPAQLITHEWLSAAAGSHDAERRALAAFAVSVAGDRGTGVVHELLEDPDARVVRAACQAAGTLLNPAYVDALVRRLDDPRLRAAAIDALASFGASITVRLAKALEDPEVPLPVRRQIPRVLRLVPDQHNVDALMRHLGHQDLVLRAAVLRALNRLRERGPELDFGEAFVTRHIFNEARTYFELHAALAPLATLRQPHSATGLLARSLEDRCKQSIERLFRLLGLRYAPVEMHAAYLALQGSRSEQMVAALEFLENVLEHSLRKVVLPVVEPTPHAAERGRELFGVEFSDAESALRELIRSGDPWLAACAMATAAEHGLRRLKPEIARLGADGPEVAEVALAAVAALE